MNIHLASPCDIHCIWMHDCSPLRTWSHHATIVQLQSIGGCDVNALTCTDNTHCNSTEGSANPAEVQACAFVTLSPLVFLADGRAPLPLVLTGNLRLLTTLLAWSACWLGLMTHWVNEPRSQVAWISADMLSHGLESMGLTLIVSHELAYQHLFRQLAT